MRRYLSFAVRAAAVFAAAGLLSTCGDGGVEGPGDDGVTGPDTIPPAAVAGLVARAPRTSSITLVWVSPGDDGSVGRAASYDVRWFGAPLNESNWDSAAAVDGVPPPKPAGQVETFVVAGLPCESDIYFALTTSDEAHNVSGLSNWSMNTTLGVPPARVTDLEAVAVSVSEYRLTWTATGDDAFDGTAAQYDIRYSGREITDASWEVAYEAVGEPEPPPSGAPDTFTVSAVAPGNDYYFAVRARDDRDNWSRLSNVAFAHGYNNRLWVKPTRVYPGQQVKVDFRASPDDVTRIDIWSPTGSPAVLTLRRHLVNAVLEPDTVHTEFWDLRDDDGRGMWRTISVQCVLKLYWGDEFITQKTVQILR